MHHNETCEALCMKYYIFNDKVCKIFLYLVSLLFLLGNIVYAGTIENIDDQVMYRLNNGEFAKDTWAWLDINGDSIKECYRLDSNGHISKNYVGQDNRKTNELGQLVENGFVIQKLSNGTIKKGDGKPFVDAEEDGKVINKLSRNGIDDLPFGVEVDNETVLTKRLNKEEIIINEHNATKSNVIYSNGGKGTINTIDSDGTTKYLNKIVAGKNIIKYITGKNNVKIDVEKAIIFGNDIWEDVIEFRGNNSFIKINTKSFNYIYFEVAEENHTVDKTYDEGVILEVYADGQLYDTLDEFVDDYPQVYEIEELDAKNIELRVKIDGKNKSRCLYIRNGRVKKIRDKDE